MEIDSLESILYCDGDQALEQDSQRLWSLLLWRYTRHSPVQAALGEPPLAAELD